MRDASRAVIEVGALAIDLAAGWVTIHGQRAALSALEYKLIAYLVHNLGRVVPAAELLENVWGCRQGGSHRQLVNVISRLRQKVEPNPDCPTYILNARGRGYYMPAHVDKPLTAEKNTPGERLEN